ncbi:hypothetical protein GJ496_006883 [Pomphorhynchus laevis]|nr:hypothetical protein GJ496_006883 [Pomphorhynchus laevis]
MLYLPVGIGGIGIRSPTRRAKAEYGWSYSMSRPLLDGLVAAGKKPWFLSHILPLYSVGMKKGCLKPKLRFDGYVSSFPDLSDKEFNLSQSRMIPLSQFCGSSLCPKDNKTNLINIDLTICMRLTFLYWVPLMLYTLMLPFWIQAQKRRKYNLNPVKPSILYNVKMFFSTCLSIISIATIAFGIMTSSRGSYVVPAFFLLWSWLSFTFISTLYVNWLEFENRKFSSMITFSLFGSMTLVTVFNIINFQGEQQAICQLLVD